jgi:hypothetical protein
MTSGEIALLIAVPAATIGSLLVLVYRWKKKSQKALDTKNHSIEKIR